MTQFWSLAALLVLFGLGLILPALLSRGRQASLARRDLNLLIHQQRRHELEAEDLDAGQAAALQTELDRTLLDDLDAAPDAVPSKPAAAGRTSVVAGILGAVAGGLLLYGQLGRLDLVRAPPASTAEARESLQATVEQLAAKLAKEPNDLQGWLLLGRSLEAMGNSAKALTAYEFARKLAPDNLDIIALYAQALAENNGGSMAGEPAKLVDGILARDPKHPTGLWLAGLGAAERDEMAVAAGYWRALAKQLPPDSEEYRTVADYIAQAEAAAPSSNAPAVAPQPASGARIAVHVTLSPALKSRAAPDDSVFVFARASEGPPMPLAVVRRQVRDLPLEVTLDDSMAMMAGRKLSSFERIVIGARISKSGKPTPSPGDLQGLSAPLPSNTTTVQSIEIHEIVP
ncbi:c-type cytochrome biogenesis protein CcmI [Methylolobus aquaticus]